MRKSSADLSSNAINTNGDDGIYVAENSAVQLGEDSGTSIYELPNSTSSNNGGFGVRCEHGGVVDGRRGTLNGVSGTTSFAGNCINDLSP